MDNTIRQYRNTIDLNFTHCGDNFTLDVPHYNKWVSIIRFLKKRGFKIGENKSFKEHFSTLSKFHKIGFKKDVALLMEINARSIKITFGNIQNLWKGIAQSFWDNPNDERYTKLTYLENIAVKLEVKKLMDYCQKFNLTTIIEDKDLSPEEFIIDKLNKNTHIHGKVTCLEDIKNSITTDSYNWTHNSDDKNGKKIICGETKYFYDYTNNRLSCGVVWHNINNMWWVICGGKLRNIACFNLFDYENGLPRKKPTDERYIDALLKKYEAKRDYKKCLDIQNYHKLNVELTD
jgi:hypothetical protein